MIQTTATLMQDLPVTQWRRHFPILKRQIHGQPLIYLDNGASMQKPACVMAAMDDCYRRYYANIHRGVHTLSAESTAAYEAARHKVQHFVNAQGPNEIIFTRGTTESINLVANSFGAKFINAGDEILITELEHHSNIVPWQLLCQRRGATLTVVPIDEKGAISLDDVATRLNERTRLVALSHISNALGTINPIKAVIDLAHQHNIPVLVDGAQAVAHQPVDVQALDCDFYAFSGHKTYGPTGIGVLYGKSHWLEQMPPWQGGGDMIVSVSFAKTEYAKPPARFEAGTPHIVGAIGLAAALDWLHEADIHAIAKHEQELLSYAEHQLDTISGLRRIGTAKQRAGSVSFVLDGVHPHDLGTVLDQQGVAIRAGHHCAQPVMEHFNVPATVRASFAAYNTFDDVDALVDGVRQAQGWFC